MEQKYILYIILAFLLGFLLKLLLDRKYCNNEQFFIDIPIKQKISLLKNSNALSSLDNILNDNIPWGIYSAETWNSSNNILPDLTGNGRDATTTNVTLNLGQGNGAVNNINYLSGDMTSSILWPTGSIPANFTICSVTRYKGTNNGRILHSTTGNWLHGHWHKSRGVAYYEGWKTQNSKGSVNDWVVCCGQNNGSIIVDDVTVAQSVNGAGNMTLGINRNNASCCPNENSDWEFSLVIIWDKTLSTQELQLISKGLNNYLKSTSSALTASDTPTVSDTPTASDTPTSSDPVPPPVPPPADPVPPPVDTPTSSDTPTPPATPPDIFTRYTKQVGKDQDGQTINKYVNKHKECEAACASNTKCQGLVVNGSTCWTIKGFPKQYNKSSSVTYRKN